jgi:predicted enzyme related to lactoylglutathione lyase
MDAFVDVPAGSLDVAHSFWSSVTGWPVGDSWAGHPEFCSFLPPNGMSYLHLQTIGEAPRVHLDLAGDTDSDTARLEQLGAARQWRGERWQVMSSPAGLPFCIYGPVSVWTLPGPTVWPDGHRSRINQLCINVPADQYDTELTFWQAATGLADERHAAGFHRLVHPAIPLQLVLHRLGDDDSATRARARLGLGTDDTAAELGRVQQLGAQQLDYAGGCTALRDPTGLPFCLCESDPGH